MLTEWDKGTVLDKMLIIKESPHRTKTTIILTIDMRASHLNSTIERVTKLISLACNRTPDSLDLLVEGLTRTQQIISKWITTQVATRCSIKVILDRTDSMEVKKQFMGESSNHEDNSKQTLIDNPSLIFFEKSIVYNYL